MPTEDDEVSDKQAKAEKALSTRGPIPTEGDRERELSEKSLLFTFEEILDRSMNEEPSGKTEGSHVGQHWAGTGTLERSDPGEGECRVSVLSAERVEWTRKGGRGGCPLTTLLAPRSNSGKTSEQQASRAASLLWPNKKEAFSLVSGSS